MVNRIQAFLASVDAIHVRSGKNAEIYKRDWIDWIDSRYILSIIVWDSLTNWLILSPF